MISSLLPARDAAAGRHTGVSRPQPALAVRGAGSTASSDGRRIDQGASPSRFSF
jgi:hypothetical protein